LKTWLNLQMRHKTPKHYPFKNNATGPERWALRERQRSQATETPVDNSTSNKCGDAPATAENKESQSNLSNNAYVAEDGRLESQSISIGSSRTQKGRASRVNPSSEGIDGGLFPLPTSSGSSTSTMFVFGSSSKIRDD